MKLDEHGIVIIYEDIALDSEQIIDDNFEFLNPEYANGHIWLKFDNMWGHHGKKVKDDLVLSRKLKIRRKIV